MASMKKQGQGQVAPLSAKQLRDRAAVVLAYADWWNHLKFKKGWATPLFTFNEVKVLLDRAAEIVVRIRAVLDRSDPSFKVRMVDGAAREYFWTLTRKPTEQPERFVRAVVHATFKDGRGYVEGLSAEQVDEFITQFDPALQPQALLALEKHDEYLASIESTWDLTHKALLDYLQELRSPHGDMPAPDACAEEKDCTKLLHQITDLGEVVRGYTERAKRRRLAVEESVDATSAESAQLHKKKHKGKGKKKRSQGLAATTATASERRPTARSVEPGDTDVESAPPSAFAISPPATAAGPTIEEMPVETDAATSAMTAVQAETEPQACDESAASVADSNSEQAMSQHHAASTSDAATPATQTDAAPPAASTQETAAEENGEEATGHVGGEESQEEHHSDSDAEADKSGSESHTSEEQPQSFSIKVQQVAAEVDEITKGVQALSENIRLLDTEKLPADPARATEVLRDLRGRCQHFTDSLLRDLTVLDSLSLPEDQRPVRKAQIQAIERLVDTVEDLTRRIRDMQTRVTVQQRDSDTQQCTTPPEPAARGSPAPSSASAGSSTHPAGPASRDRARLQSEEIDEDLAALWCKLRLQVRLDVDDAGDGYAIQGYIPGLRSEHIKVQLSSDGSSLTVSGTRLPSAREVASLQRSLARQGNGGIEALLHAGAGRYGTFSQQFRLPANADRERISADYNGGVLRVVVPKRQPTRTHLFSSPPPQRAPLGQARGGYGGFPGFGARPRSMFDDGDFWW